MTQNSKEFSILNDYCLETILSHLDIKTQLQFAKVSKQFLKIFICWAKRKHTTIERSIFQQLTENEWKEYIKLVGFCVTKCDYGVPAGTMVYVKKYCPQIREIYCPLWAQNDRDVALHLKTLHTMHFHENCTNEQMEETVLRLKKLPNLNCISIMSLSYEGKHLCQLTRLKELHFLGCSSFLPENLIACFHTMKNLRFLNLYGLDSLITTEVFTSLTNYCKNLEEIQFVQIDVDYGRLANLSKLKCLVISCKQKSVNIIINALAVSSLSNQLVELTLEYSKITYQDAKLIALFKSLKKLHVGVAEDRCLEQFVTLNNLVHLEVFSYKKYHHKYILNMLKNCPQLETFKTYKLKNYKQFIIETIEVLRLIRNPKIQAPLVIHIPEEFFSEEKALLKSTEYKNARHLIKVMLKNAQKSKNIVTIRF